MALRSRAGAWLRQVGLIHVPATAFNDVQLQQLREVRVGGAPAAQFSDVQLQQLRDLAEELGADDDPAVLDEYCSDVPSPQTVADLFAGEWASAFPEPLSWVTAGRLGLFDDPRIAWCEKVLGPVAGARVLELGPLEGGHTYALDRLGAREVVAVEANGRAYLKCLVVKELLGIPSARFLHGDAVRYVESELALDRGRFDLVVASGVLYHLLDPVRALQLLTRATDRLLLWTMYYDADVVAESEVLTAKFTGRTEQERAGFRHTLYRQEYQGSLAHRGFCGGSAATSAWLSRADILGALEHFGFEVVDTAFERRDHEGLGSSFCVAARRRDS